MDFFPSPRLLAFQPGHVLTLGGDQYRIHRKLRGQTVSTVWLAEHTVRGHRLPPAVSVELCFPTTHLNYIRNIIASQDRALAQNIATAYAPSSSSTATSTPNLSFSLAVTKRIIADTLRALQYIHSFGRAASHPSEMVDPSANSKKSLSSTNGSTTGTTGTPISSSPKTKSSTPSKGKDKSPATPLTTKASATPKPKSLAAVLKAQSLPAFGLSPSLDNIQVRLTRCEHAPPAHAKEGNKPARLGDYYHSELKLCSPEALLTNPFGITSVFQFLTGHYIYGLHPNPEVEGPALPSWLELVLISHPRTRMLEERLRSFAHATAGMSANDVRATCAFIGRCLEMDPAKRATAAEPLQDAWFR
ncbi:kinase-like protein [Ganoderma leucocontextum]|nr:kinase-like protein [Ganoderma leucocontextum]